MNPKIIHSITFRLCIIFLLFFSLYCKKGVANEKYIIDIRIDERVADFCKRMEKKGNFTCKELADISHSSNMNDFVFLNKNIAGLKKFEGVFRPGSYHYSQSKTLEEIVLELLKISENKYTISNKQKLNIQEIIVLASIVEKESVSNRDYARIARVFLNRLKKNEPLGSCPTVEYVLGFHRPFLLFKDLEIKSPYNVYKNKGLPPTAIAFFSNEALQAVLEPIQGNEYFFVYDWTTGSLQFAEKYNKHKKNAQVARKNFIQKYGKKIMYKPFYNKYYENID